MIEELTLSNETPTPEVSDSRRDFLNRAGKIAVTAPAAALLLAASTRSSQAQSASNPPQRQIG